MGVFSFTESTVQQLLQDGMIESAEYWSSLYIYEKNLNSDEKAKRFILYADCLFKNRKYQQAKDYYEMAISMYSIYAKDENYITIVNDLHFKLYQCEYEACQDKENRNMLRSCILQLESIRESDRSLKILSALTRLYWSCNYYSKARLSAYLVLQQQPLAIEAIQILSRLHDFDGMKEIEPLNESKYSLSVEDKCIEDVVIKAEYELYHNPNNALISYRKISNVLSPSPTIYHAISMCYFSLHQLQDCVRWLDMMHSIDSSQLFDYSYGLAIILSRTFNLNFSPSQNRYECHQQTVLNLINMVISDERQAITQLRQHRFNHPFLLPLMLIDCFASHQQELPILEAKYWEIINYYPSYFSYSLLINFYIDESMIKKAQIIAEQIVKANSEDLHANLLVAKVYICIPGLLKKAEKILRRCYDRNCENLETVYLLARVYSEKNDYENAIKILSKAVDKNTPNEVKKLLCECYLKTKQTIPYLLHQLDTPNLYVY